MLLLLTASCAAVNQYLMPAQPTAANLLQRVFYCGPRQTDGHCAITQTLL